MESVGERIRKRRKELGLTQEDLEHLSGVSTETISKAERGEQDIKNIETLARIAMALDVNLYHLVPNGTLDLLKKSKANLAFIKFCDSLNTFEKIQTMEEVIGAVSKHASTLIPSQKRN